MAFAVGEQVVALAKMKGSGGNKIKPGWKGHCIALEPKYVSFSFEIKHDSLFGNIQGFTTVRLSHEEAATKVSGTFTGSNQTREQPPSPAPLAQTTTKPPPDRILSSAEIIDKLTQLKSLLDSGVITTEEFNNLKIELTSKSDRSSERDSDNSGEPEANEIFDVWIVGIGDFHQSPAQLEQIRSLVFPWMSVNSTSMIDRSFKKLRNKGLKLRLGQNVNESLALSYESEFNAMGLVVEVVKVD